MWESGRFVSARVTNFAQVLAALTSHSTAGSIEDPLPTSRRDCCASVDSGSWQRLRLGDVELLTHGMTGPTARLVRVERADLDRRAAERSRPAVDQPLRHRRRAAAPVAHGFELVDELRHAEERRHGAERQPAEVLRESGGDDTCTLLNERVDRVD